MSTAFSELLAQKQEEVRKAAERIAAEDGVDLQTLLFLIGATDKLPKQDPPEGKQP